MTELEKLKEEIVIAAKAFIADEGDIDELHSCLEDAVEALLDYEVRE